MNRRSITLVIVVVLCAVWFAYGHDWLHPSRTGAEIESNKVGAHPARGQEKMQDGAVQVAPQVTEPAATPKD